MNLRRFLVALAGLSLLGCGGAEVRPDGPPPELGRCLLLTTNDTEANFDGKREVVQGKPVYEGTISRVAAEKRALQQARPGSVLLVDGGDVLQGRFLEREDGDRSRAAREIWQVYEAAGYDYGTLGNHEFDGGPKVLRSALQGLTRYRVLVANLDAAGTSLDPRDPGRPQGLFGRTQVVRCGGVRVGLFGLLTPTTKFISDFGDLRFASPDDPVRAPAREAVAELKSAGAQVIVALSHLGLDEDVALAEAVTGIDAIVGGHSHTVLPEPRRVGNTLITQTGARLQNLGYLDLVPDGDGDGLDLQQTTWQLRPIDATLPQDETLEWRVARLRGDLLKERVVGERKSTWDLTNPREDYGPRVARAVARWAQRTTGQPIDGVLLNAGGFRSATVYPPGPVTSVELQAIHPFKNRIVLVKLTGAQLRDVLEHACAAPSEAHGAKAVTWGLQMRCDMAQPAVRYRFEASKPVAIEQPGQRAVELAVGGKPLDPKRTYTLATLDYLARGGSGYLALEQAQARTCPDAKPFDPKTNCPGSLLLSELVEQAVRDGSFEQPLVSPGPR